MVLYSEQRSLDATGPLRRATQPGPRPPEPQNFCAPTGKQRGDALRTHNVSQPSKQACGGDESAPSTSSRGQHAGGEADAEQWREATRARGNDRGLGVFNVLGPHLINFSLGTRGRLRSGRRPQRYVTRDRLVYSHGWNPPAQAAGPRGLALSAPLRALSISPPVALPRDKRGSQLQPAPAERRAAGLS